MSHGLDRTHSNKSVKFLLKFNVSHKQVNGQFLKSQGLIATLNCSHQHSTWHALVQQMKHFLF